MITYFLVFLFQFGFNIFKTMEIKYTYENKVTPLLVNSVWINMFGLGSTFFSLERLLNDDWFVIIVFISGSVIGKWFAMTHFINYESKLLQFINKKKKPKNI